jgi:hypothetical protein
MQQHAVLQGDVAPAAAALRHTTCSEMRMLNVPLLRLALLFVFPLPVPAVVPATDAAASAANALSPQLSLSRSYLAYISDGLD